MKVAFDGRSLVSKAPRGWDRYAIELISRLPQFGVQPYLLYRDGEPLVSEHVTAAGCEAVALPSRTVAEWEQVSLPRFLQQERFDLYHAVAERGVPLFAGCPVVLTLHSLTQASYRDLIRKGLLPGPIEEYLSPSPSLLGDRYAQMQYRMADHIIVPSAFCADEVTSLLPAPRSKITVTPLGVPREFRDRPHSEVEVAKVLTQFGVKRPYVLYVGGYERHKNVRGLMSVFAELNAHRPDVSFVVVGTNVVPSEFQQSLPANVRCHFLANLTSELVPLYDGASALVTMSWRESFCLPALEALSRGVPTVASTWGAAREVVGETGQLVDPRSTREAVLAVLEVLRANSDPVALRRRAEGFSWDRCAELTHGVYQSLLRRRGPLTRARRIARRVSDSARAIVGSAS